MNLPTCFPARASVAGIALAFVLSACAPQTAPLDRPNGAAAAPEGGVYVMDFGNYRIAHLSAEGDLLGAFGQLGVGPNDIFYGWDMAVDVEGNLYICNQILDDADTTHEGVKVFSSDGKFLREIGGVDYEPGVGRVYSVYALDLDNAGRVYTADFGTATVRVFDADGGPLAELFGEVGTEAEQFDGLNDVAIDDARGLMYVSDSLNSRVQQFTLGFEGGAVTATYQRSFGTYGRNPGQFAYLQNLAVDETTGRLYVGDLANRRIQIFDSDGKYISEIGAPVGPKDWQVMGLNIGGDGALYVADAFNNAVWVFEAGGRLRQKFKVRP